MSDMENARAHKEALETSSRESSSAGRQRRWAGMHRYLAAETERAHRAAEQQERDQQTKPPDAHPGPA